MSIKTNCVRKRVHFFLNNDRLSDVKFVDANSNGESKQVIPAHKFILAAIALPASRGEKIRPESGGNLA